MNSKICSVIVPIYNAAPFLAQCLSSIKMQTYHDLQIILINDGSTDESGEIAQSFVNADTRFALYQQSNQGQGAARNRALSYATGDFLVFVDADDYLDTDFIERHMAALGDADYVQSGYRRVAIEGDIIDQKLPIHRYQFTSACMRLYRTQWIKQHNLFFPEDMIYEDVIFSLLCWNTHPQIKIIKYIGYNYTYNPLSTTLQSRCTQDKFLLSYIQTMKINAKLKILTKYRLLCHFYLTSFIKK